MQIKHSLRIRVSLGFTLFVCIIAGLLAFAIIEVTEEDEDNLINRIVSEEMTYFIEQYRINPATPLQRTQNFYGYISRNNNERQRLPALIRDLPPGVHEVGNGDTEFHIVVRDYKQTRFYLTYDVTYHEQRLDRFIDDVLLMLAVVFILSFAASYLIAGSLLLPVTDLAKRVVALRADDTSPKLAQRYKSKEVVGLARAFDNHLALMADLVAREKAFTSDVSHELRTPLTAMRTSCELLIDDDALANTSRQRVERMMQSIDRMTELVNAFLLLARGKTPANMQYENLLSTVNDVALLFQNNIVQNNLDLNIDIGPDIDVRAEPGILHIVLSNLLDNAITHTLKGDIKIRYQNNSLEVIDTGKGIAATDLPKVFKRFYRAEDNDDAHSGAGLGLAIVKRICDLYGWRITLSSQAGEGTHIRLCFAPDSLSSQ